MKNFLLLSIIILGTVATTGCTSADLSGSGKYYYSTDDSRWEIHLPLSWKPEPCKNKDNICFVDEKDRGIVQISIFKVSSKDVKNIAIEYFKNNSQIKIKKIRHVVGKIWEGNIYYAIDNENIQLMYALLSYNDNFLFARFLASDHDFMLSESSSVLNCFVNISREEITTEKLVPFREK